MGRGGSRVGWGYLRPDTLERIETVGLMTGRVPVPAIRVAVAISAGSPLTTLQLSIETEQVQHIH